MLKVIQQLKQLHFVLNTSEHSIIPTQLNCYDNISRFSAISELE